MDVIPLPLAAVPAKAWPRPGVEARNQPAARIRVGVGQCKWAREGACLARRED